MKTQLLGRSSLVSSRLSYGNMRSVGTWNPAEVTPERMAKAVQAHIAAYEAGYTLFDTADIYCRGMCETALGNTLKQVSGMRDRILIATKCGIRFAGDPAPDSPHRYDFSAQHIERSVEGTLSRLGVETIDVFHLHRPDLLMNPPEIAAAFDRVRSAGKVREFAVSNFSPSFVAALQAHLPFPLVANQVEIHLGRLDPFTDGTLDQCIERTITPLSWSPLAGGWLGAGRTLPADAPNRENRQKLLDVLDATATEHGVSRTVIALAWLLKHPSQIIPIIGSATPANIVDAAKADDIDLTRDQWYRILLAARGKALP
ncbi:MAG TPA: aldo/keto reductase [Tepidisphaeraceae bacterium]|jgi:predicted oxidoreductase|nr:aldo/keto reductase [Tepidisphaeraceae bacterium]